MTLEEYKAEAKLKLHIQIDQDRDEFVCDIRELLMKLKETINTTSAHLAKWTSLLAELERLWKDKKKKNIFTVQYRDRCHRAIGSSASNGNGL